ncbi:MAG: hypothetical protein JOZ07_00875 [Solirubrobacterales bacterium]|nr:hypothetical protein [Solirubrobacterales bacterium]
MRTTCLFAALSMVPAWGQVVKPTNGALPPVNAAPAPAAPADSPPPPGPNGGHAGRAPELETVAACWPAVIELVREENQMLAALLADTTPVSLADGGLTVAFPAGKAFLKRKAEQDDYRRSVADALRSMLGATLALRYELRDDAELESGTADTISQDELVKRLVEEFDAQEVLDDPDQEG